MKLTTDLPDLMPVLFAFPFQRVRSAQLKFSRSSALVEIISISSEGLGANEGNVAGRFSSGSTIHRHHSSSSDHRAFLLCERGSKSSVVWVVKTHRHGCGNSVAARSQSRKQSERRTMSLSYCRVGLSSKLTLSFFLRFLRS